MTEETTQEVTAVPENNNMNISVEQILAAVIKTTGDVTVSLEDLIANYSQKTISVNQLEDKSVLFSLIDVTDVPSEEIIEESAE
jgi:hypothetical protein